jgi:hypothetical protein
MYISRNVIKPDYYCYFKGNVDGRLYNVVELKSSGDGLPLTITIMDCRRIFNQQQNFSNIRKYDVSGQTSSSMMSRRCFVLFLFPVQTQPGRINASLIHKIYIFII